jgi:serine/threonine protein kinase/tetratricopeptide (TPR) repeat protein
MPLASGTRFTHYEIRSLLGVGGMGEVYLAHDNKLRRSVALKILSPDLRSNEEWLRRFESEAYAASSLNHPNILTVYEIGSAEIHFEDETNETGSGTQQDGMQKLNRIDFIATEYIEGESLRQYLTKDTVQFRALLDIGVQVASALAAAHSAGIVHRDIKPENIMVRRDHVVKVLDFGLAKIFKQTIPSDDEPTRAMHHTASGVVMGTASYLSPEQARGKNVDERSDIWSLGIVLYEMATGRLPFTGETTNDVIAGILTKEPQPLDDLHPEFERIVTKSLRKDRDERYQVVKDLLLDLKSLKQRVEFEAELERTGSGLRSEKRSGSAKDRASVGTETDSTFVLSDQQARTPGIRASTLSTPAAVAETQAPTSALQYHPTSSAEYLVNEIKRHKRGALALVAIVLLAAIATSYFLFNRRAATTTTSTGVASIAVLPFENAGNNPNAEYLSDGISESIINALSQLPRVKVIARSSSFQYKGKNANPEEIAKALGVDLVLTGRVSHLGDNLLISAELVNASDRTQIWGEQYNRKVSEIIHIPADISREIAEKLRLRLSATDQQRLAKGGTDNPRAFELLLQAKHAFEKGDTESLKKSAGYAERAIQLDPNYALAQATLSLIYSGLIQGSMVAPGEFRPRANEAARKAIELDDNLPDAHFAMSYVKTLDWKWSEAEQELKRALALNPNMAGAHYGYSLLLSIMKRTDQALSEAQRARELDPLSPFVNANVGNILLFAGRYDEAMASLKKVIESERTFPVAHLYLGYAYSAKGEYREAIAALHEGIKLGGDSPSVQIYLGDAYARSGERGKALSILKQMQTTKDPVSPTELAILYSSLGEMDQAFASLEKAYAARDAILPWIVCDPGYRSLRADARYAGLVRKIGLQP